MKSLIKFLIVLACSTHIVISFISFNIYSYVLFVHALKQKQQYWYNIGFVDARGDSFGQG